MKPLAKRISRVALVVFAGLFTLILLLIATPIGTKGLLAIADKALSPLNIEHHSGSLAGELKLKQVHWRTESIHASVSDLLLNIEWQCVFRAKICIEEISSSGIQTNVFASNEPVSEPTTEPGLVTLPLSLSINKLALARVDVVVEDTLSLTLMQFETALSMHQTLNVNHFSWANLHIDLPATEANTHSTNYPTSFNPEDIANWQYTPPTLKPLFFPVLGQIKHVNLGGISVTQSGKDVLAINNVLADIAISEEKLAIERFELAHEMGNLSLTSHISPALEYQLHLHADYNDQSVVADLLSSGSPSNVHITLKSSGLITSTASIEANLLSQELPLNANVQWQNMKWPLTGVSTEIRSDNGNLSVQGTLQQYLLNLKAQIAGEKVPSTDLQLALSGNQRKASIEKLQIDTLNGQLNAAGKLTIDNSIHWLGELGFSHIQPHVFFPDLEADLSGKSAYEASFDGNHYSAHLTNVDMTGRWRGYELLTRGEGAFDSTSGLEVPRLSVEIGDNLIDMNATISPTQALKANLTVTAQDLAQLLPDLQGRINLNSTLAGTLSEPEIQFSVDAQSVKFNDIKVKELKGSGGTRWSQDLTTEKPIDLDITVNALQVAQQQINTLHVDLTGTTQKHSSTLSFSMKLEDRDVKFDTQIDGGLNGNFTQWVGNWVQGEILSDVVSFKLDQSQPQIVVNWQDGNYMLGAHCWSDEQANLCIKDARFEQDVANFDVSSHSLPIINIVSQIAPDIIPIQSDTLLSFEAKGTYAQNKQNLTLNTSLTPADWLVGRKGASFHLEQLTSTTSLNGQQVNSELSMLSNELGQLGAQVTVDDIQNSRTLSGDLILAGFNIEHFQDLTPQLTQLSGFINANVNLSGELSKPLLRGELTLEKGNFEGPVLPSKISQVNQRVILKGKAADLSGSYHFGNGLGEVDGHIDWKDKPFGHIAIRGDNMEIDHQNLIRARVSPHVDITFSEDALSVEGEVAVPYARVKVRDLPPSALSPSDDVVIVNQTEEDETSSRSLNLNLRIKVDEAKANNVKVDAFGLTSDLQGNLLVTDSGTVIIGDGQLNLVNGRYRAYGQDLTIRRGEVQFNGPVDSPFLNIEAIRNPEKTADGVIAGLRVEGLSHEPDISVFSIPELEQPQALSYLLRGQRIGGPKGENAKEESSNDAALANALIGFGLSKGENKISKIGSKLGIEDFAVATSGQGNDTKVAVSGSIAPGVQLRYGVGVFDSASEVALRYQLLPKLYLEAISGLNNALDIYYQFDIDNKKTTKLLDEVEQ